MFVSHTLDVFSSRQLLKVWFGPFRREIGIQIDFDVLRHLAGTLYTVFDEFDRYRKQLEVAAANAIRRARARAGDTVEITLEDLPGQ